MAEAELMMLSEITDQLNQLLNKSGSADLIRSQEREILELKSMISKQEGQIEQLTSQNQELLQLEQEGLKLKEENLKLRENLKIKEQELLKLNSKAEALTKALGSADSFDYATLSNNLHAAANESAKAVNRISNLSGVMLLNWIVIAFVVLFIGGSYWVLRSNIKDTQSTVNDVYWGIYTKPTSDSPSHSAINWSYSWQLEQERREKME